MLRLLLLLLLLGPAAALAQTLTGRVVAAGTGAPLPAATVRLDGQPGSGASTDEAGRFTLPAAGPDARLVFSRLGYQSQTLPAASLPPEVKLEELSYQIGEVLVRYESIRKLLLRKWRLDEGSLDVAGQRLLAALEKKDPAKAAKLAKNPDAVRSVLKMARYIFHDDGTVKVRILLFGSAAEWRLDEPTRRLRVVDREGQQAEVDVVELSDTRLVLQRPDQPALVYVPAD